MISGAAYLLALIGRFENRPVYSLAGSTGSHIQNGLAATITSFLLLTNAQA